MTCTKWMTSGMGEQAVPLEKGPDGFLVAKFADAVHVTELCNLMMFAAPKQKAPVMKKPGAAPVMKETGAAIAPAVPAAAIAAAPGPPAAPGPVPPAGEEPPKNDYGIMWYAKQKTIGIRAKFGRKNQVFSFGGMRCTKTEAEMKTIAKTIVADLHNGMSVVDAKQKGMRLAGLAD